MWHCAWSLHVTFSVSDLPESCLFIRISFVTWALLTGGFCWLQQILAKLLGEHCRRIIPNLWYVLMRYCISCLSNFFPAHLVTSLLHASWSSSKLYPICLGSAFWVIVSSQPYLCSFFQTPQSITCISLCIKSINIKGKKRQTEL